LELPLMTKDKVKSHQNAEKWKSRKKRPDFCIC